MLRAGGTVAFPTETVYGLGANALDSTAVAKIFAAKGRPSNNPLIVHVANVTDARELACEWPELAERLAEKFWPGPLSLVVRKQRVVPDNVTAGGDTVAIRCPLHPVAAAIVKAAGVPIAAPSANLSNRISATTADHVELMLQGRIDLIVDGGSAWQGIESTVLDVTSDPPRILRLGPIGAAELELFIGRPVESAVSSASDEGALPSPGMLTKHYAPTVPMELVDNDRERVEALADEGRRVGWLAIGERLATSSNVAAVFMPADATQYASVLYRALHELEAAGVDCIVARKPPANADWAAVIDRLTRAAAKE